MSERVAIVAGAGGDLGRSVAGKLAAAGFTVAGVDRSEGALTELPDGTWRAAADPAVNTPTNEKVVHDQRERATTYVVALFHGGGGGERACGDRGLRGW